jgi:hypothetical protein
MEAFIRRTKPAVSGAVISLAVVLGSGQAFAEVLAGFGSQVAPLIGSFSDSDLQALEHASAAEATAARRAAIGAYDAARSSVRSRSSIPGDVAPEAEGDVFRHSSLILPLLVTRPDASGSIATASVTLRPGLVQPVGVSPAALRSRTPSERAAR